MKARAEATRLDYVVDSDGPSFAEVALVGEGPGVSECKAGRPFVGGAGFKLWAIANTIGLNKANTYVTNVVKRQISLAVKTDDRIKVTRQEFGHWKAILLHELMCLPNLKYVVCMGGMALDAVLQVTGVNNWRGSVVDTVLPNGKRIKVIVTHNPAYVQREPKFEVFMKMDFAKLKMVMDGTFKDYPIEALINPTYHEAMAWITKMRRDKLPVSFDIETIGQELACVGLTNDPHKGMCINLRTEDEHRYTPQEERNLMMALALLLGDRSTKLVAQNGGFDSYFTWYKSGIKVHGIWFDTLLAHHTLYPTLPHSLAFLTAQYTTHPFYKDEGKNWREGGNIDQFWEYNVKDICITLAASQALHEELRTQNLDGFFFGHVMRAQAHLVRSTVFGLPVDVELKEQVRTELEVDINRMTQEFLDAAREIVGDPQYTPNPSSNVDMTELWFSKLKLVGRGTSNDAANRKAMRNHLKTPPAAKVLIDKYDKLVKEKKFYSTYAGTTLDEDQRIRCEWKQFGTMSAPGRLSSTQTLWGTGMNLQNQPERAKIMYMADPGCGYAYFDLSQAEARYVGWDYEIEAWIEQFEMARLQGNYDCHRALASEMWGIPYDEVPLKDHDENGNFTLRYIAKRCRHGLNYRMMPDRLASVTGLAINMAADAWNRYHTTTPELQVGWKNTIDEFKKNGGTLWNSMGRRFKVIQSVFDDSVMDSLIAFKPQSTVGDKVTQVWYQAEDDEDFPPYWRVALNVHDALIAHGPLNEYRLGSRFVRANEQALRVMVKHAEKPIMVKGRELIIPAEGALSLPDEKGVHRWSTLKKIDREVYASMPTA